MNILENAGLKRLAAFLVTFLALLLSKKLGIELTSEEKAELVALTIAFIGQSAWKEASLAKSEAAGKLAAGQVQTVDAAIIKLEERTKGPHP